MSVAVGIVEDDADVGEDLARILAGAPEFRCVCRCRNVESALRDLPAARPDVVIMDISLPDGSGIECVRALKRELPDAQFLMFTVHQDNERIFQALAAGASGYLLKRSRASELLAGLRDLVAGGVPMTPGIARRVIASFREERPAPANPAISALSPREHAVLVKLAEGLSDKEIASQLGISPETVNVHLKHIYHKLHVRSRTEAVIAFMR
jgi:DNA-binding NarL/FixJ family response regulator